MEREGERKLGKMPGKWIKNTMVTKDRKEPRNERGYKGHKRNFLLTSMCRSVALVNESITRERTAGRGRCLGNDAPGAGV